MSQEQIDKALAEALERLPSRPRIVRLTWEPYVDMEGDEALKIVVVMDEKTTDRQIEKAPILQITETVTSSLHRHGVKEFPYFYFEREHEREVTPGSR